MRKPPFQPRHVHLPLDHQPRRLWMQGDALAERAFAVRCAVDCLWCKARVRSTCPRAPACLPARWASGASCVCLPLWLWHTWRRRLRSASSSHSSSTSARLTGYPRGCAAGCTDGWQPSRPASQHIGIPSSPQGSSPSATHSTRTSTTAERAAVPPPRRRASRRHHLESRAELVELFLHPLPRDFWGLAVNLRHRRCHV